MMGLEWSKIMEAFRHGQNQARIAGAVMQGQCDIEGLKRAFEERDRQLQNLEAKPSCQDEKTKRETKD